jgi:hypothetical protein
MGAHGQGFILHKLIVVTYKTGQELEEFGEMNGIEVLLMWSK